MLYLSILTFSFHIAHVIESCACVGPSVSSSNCRLELKLGSFSSPRTIFKLPEKFSRGKCLKYIGFSNFKVHRVCHEVVSYSYLCRAKKISWSQFFLNSLNVRRYSDISWRVVYSGGNVSPVRTCLVWAIIFSPEEGWAVDTLPLLVIRACTCILSLVSFRD